MTVRNDTGVYEGGEISIFYDPMIAKLVTHAPTREAADRGAGARARRLCHRRHPPQHPVPLGAHGASALACGRLSTGFIAEEFPDGFVPPAPEGETAHLLAAVARRHRAHDQRAQAHDLRPVAGRKRHVRAERVVALGGADLDVAVERIGRGPRRAVWQAAIRMRSIPTGFRASRSGPALSTVPPSPFRSARSSTALALRMAASRRGARVHAARGRTGRPDAREGGGRYG